MKRRSTPMIACAALAAALAAPADRGPEWAGHGKYRLLVQVPPRPLGPRRSDTMPAEIVVDFARRLAAASVRGKADLLSLQVVRYDPKTGRALPFSDYAYRRGPADRPFRWYDGAIPYDFPEFAEAVSATNGEIRRRPMARGGHFYNILGDGEHGRLAWIHTQDGAAASHYGVYFDVLEPGAEPAGIPPGGWLGDGMARAEPVAPSTTGASHTRIEVDDWDGDGRTDILYGEDYGHLFWIPNRGTRIKPEFPYSRIVSGADGLPIDTGISLAPLVVDFDGDGVKDLVAGAHWNRVVWFRNVGTDRQRKLDYRGFVQAGGRTMELPFRPIRGRVEEPFKRDYYPVLDSCDWDGDGDPDLLAGGYVTGRIYFFENKGRAADGTPLLDLRGPLDADGAPLNVGDWCAAPTIRDLDGDGDLDLISGNIRMTAASSDENVLGVAPGARNNFLVYYENAGTRRVPQLHRRPFPGEGTFPTGSLATPRAADLNGDGLLDLVVSSGRNIYLFPNVGTRSLPKFAVNDRALPASWGNSPLPGTGPQTPTQFIDWNRDGRLDIVSNFKVWLDAGKGNPGVYEPAVSLLPAGVEIAHPSKVGDDWFWPRLYDIDRDGRLDVLFGDWWGRIWFHRNVAGGTPARYDTAGYPLRLTSGDVLRVGPGDVNSARDFAALQGARTVFAAADFDADGLDDLVVGDTYGKVRYYRNAGSREAPLFAGPVLVGDLGGRLLVDAGDWDRDGRPDIVAGASNGRVEVYLNTGTKGAASFAAGFSPKLPLIVQPRVMMVDWNGDGDDDLFLPGTQGSILVERSFLEAGYARGEVVRLESRNAAP